MWLSNNLIKSYNILFCCFISFSKSRIGLIPGLPKERKNFPGPCFFYYRLGQKARYSGAFLWHYTCMLIEKTGNIMSLHETSGFATQPNAPLRQMPSLQTNDLKLPKSTGFNMFGKDGFTFFDMLDIINPLQHLPGISFLYRKITGDTIDPGSRIIGGTILGGPIGAIANLGDVLLQRETGKDLAESATSLFLAKEQKKEINFDKTNATANTIGQETAKKFSPKEL